MIPHYNSKNKISYQFYTIRKKIVLSVHYKGSKSFLFAKATNIYQFKAKDSEKKNNYVLCLGNILKDITINNMKEVRVKGT